ncbi:MAG: transporter ATP-binding protein [Microbacteriaceae bacterium]|nr:transporter ATP-binding protein [Microbacteriaceae bacterium]
MATGGGEVAVSIRDVAVAVRDVSVHYRSNGVPSEYVAVRGVTFDIRVGEILGLVGESGSGKSTLGLAIAGRSANARPGSGIPEICGGSIAVYGAGLRGAGRRTRDRVTLRVGHLAQDGAEKLNPTFTVAENVAEPIFERDKRFDQRIAADAVATLIDAVRLPLGVMNKLPYELSSGQRQRVAIARALILEPTLLVADEPTRGVDATVRGGVLAAIRDLQLERAFSALVISSDLSVVSTVAHRVAVMQGGVLVGLGELDEMLDGPHHPYLKGLVRARRFAEESSHAQRS